MEKQASELRLELFREARRAFRRNENALVWSSVAFFVTLFLSPAASLLGAAGFGVIPAQIGICIAIYMFQVVCKYGALEWSKAAERLLSGVVDAAQVPWEKERSPRSFGVMAHLLTTAVIGFEFAAIVLALVFAGARLPNVAVTLAVVALPLGFLFHFLFEKFHRWARGVAEESVARGTDELKSVT